LSLSPARLRLLDPRRHGQDGACPGLWQPAFPQSADPRRPPLPCPAQRAIRLLSAPVSRTRRTASILINSKAMDFPDLPGHLAQVRETTARHQAIGGWTHPVKIVAVTKTHGPEAVRAAVAAGLRDIGENRVQEALEKQDALAGVRVEWHLIGTLQRNKARHASGRFA